MTPTERALLIALAYAVLDHEVVINQDTGDAVLRLQQNRVAQVSALLGQLLKEGAQ